MTREQFDMRLHFIKSYSGSDAGRAAETELFDDMRRAAAELEAALRLLREECQDEGRCSQVGHRVSLPCVKLVDEALGIAPPFGADQ